MAHSNEKNLSYMLVVTSEAVAERTIDQLQKEKYSDYIVKGLAIVDADMIGQSINGVPVVANEDTLH